MAAPDGLPMLVGRQAEMERLSALAGRAAAGGAAIVLIEGEPGIGKTSLLDVAEAECARLGIRVARGRAEDLEQRLPFAAIGACLGLRTAIDDAGAARVATLLRGEAIGRSVAAANHEFAVTEAILDLVDQWCATSPVALLVDDAQWADQPSVVALHRLATALGQEPLFLVIASRTMPRGEALTGLVRSLASQGAELLRLAPLDQPAVAAVVEQTVGAPAGPHLLELVSRAGGNPMYLTEVLAALIREDAITVAADAAEVSDEVMTAGPSWVPASLVEAILRRLDFLPRKTRETLQMAAVLGRAIDVSQLTTVLGTPVAELTENLVTAMDSGLLVNDGQRLLFRHDLIREVLAEHLPGPLRTALHLRAGQALAAVGAPAEQVAEHLLAGTAFGRDILDWLTQAADTLIVRAPALAVRLLRQALAAEPDTADTLRIHLVRALLWEGSLAEAEQAARAALTTRQDPALDGALRWLLVQACYRQGRLDDTVAAAKEALSSPQLTSGDTGRFLGFIALCEFWMARFDAAEAAARAAIRMGEGSGDPRSQGLGLISLSALRFMQGDMQQALELNDRALAALGRGIQPDLQVDPYAMRGYCLLELDRFGEADAALATALRHNHDSGGVYLPVVYEFRAQLRFLDGHWDDAVAEIQAGLDSPDPLGQAGGLRGLAALIAIHRDQIATDQASGDTTDYEAAEKYASLERWAQALAQETRQGPRHALDWLYPVWEHAGGLNPRRIAYYICPDLARLALDAQDDVRLRALAATTAELLGDDPIHSLRGTAQLCQGMADADPETLLAAAASFAQIGWPLYEGYAHENAAVLLARRGLARDARAALDRALALYGGLDAAWDTARAEARLRQVGVRRGVRGVRKRPKFGWEALTDTERRVVQFVAEGLSNPDIAARMFLSRRTVQTHVSSILGKLSLTSRVELAINASRRQPLAQAQSD